MPAGMEGAEKITKDEYGNVIDAKVPNPSAAIEYFFLSFVLYCFITSWYNPHRFILYALHTTPYSSLDRCLLTALWNPF